MCASIIETNFYHHLDYSSKKALNVLLPFYLQVLRFYNIGLDHQLTFYFCLLLKYIVVCIFGNVQVDVNTEVGVVRDIRLKELRIYTDYGRCSRPLFIVEKQRLLIKKKDIQALQLRVCSNFLVAYFWTKSSYCGTPENTIFVLHSLKFIH